MRWAFVAAMCMMVAMCGQKGPLYLPEEQAQVVACSVEPTMHFTLKTSV